VLVTFAPSMTTAVKRMWIKVNVNIVILCNVKHVHAFYFVGLLPCIAFSTVFDVFYKIVSKFSLGF